MSIDLEKQQVRVKWRYTHSLETVYRAVERGRLLATCGGKMDEFRHDFRVGGKFQFAWGEGGEDRTCRGEYLEIVPQARVRWTWNDVRLREAPPSEVTLTLSQRGAFTLVEIFHERTPNAELAHSYHQGWTEVLALFEDEIDGTTLRLSHDFSAAAPRVLQAVKDGELFRCMMKGEAQITTIAPSHVKFTWATKDAGVTVTDTDVSIFCESLPAGGTRLHLVHDGLVPKNVSQSQEEGWSKALASFAGALR